MKKNYKNEIITFLRNLYQKYQDDKSVLYLTLILEFIQDYYPDEYQFTLSIDVLKLNKRLSNILKRNGIHYIDTLLEFDEDDLVRFRGISLEGAKFIMHSLDKYLNGDCECYF